MHIKAIVALFAVLCLSLVAGQDWACDELQRKCELCIRTLNNIDDARMPVFNDECREKLRRTWRWRNVGRCELIKLNCMGINRPMNCRDVAELARMQRVRP